MNYFFYKISKWRFITLPILVAILGLLSMLYTTVYVDRSLKEGLLQRARTVAETLNSKEISTLQGVPEEVTAPNYLEIKRRLHNVILANPDARFVYLMGWRDKDPFFFVDSEPAESPDVSPPGQVYTEASNDIRSAFSTRAPAIGDVYKDRWGTWLTAVAPIIDPDTGNLVAVVGMDIDAHRYIYTIITYVAIPGVIATLLIFLALGGLYVRKKELQELNLKSELVSIASHEIRTPLTGISWATDSLLKEHTENLSQEQKDDIQLIKNVTQRLLLIVNDLLDLSATENLKTKKVVRQKIVMLPFFHDIVDNFKLSFREKELGMTFDASLTDTISIMGDTDRIKRLFNNLFSNAIKYSKVDGVITVGCMPNEKSNVFFIKDNGIGIPAKDISRIFKGFYRAENAKQSKESGTGLGLQYVQQVAKLHGGKVWCESKEDIGSTFYVELPRA